MSEFNNHNSEESSRPTCQLKTNRSLAKMFFLGLITFGIYDIVAMSEISVSINKIATRHDSKKTMHYCLLFFVFSWLTLGIGIFVWYHRLSQRIGIELQKRGIEYKMSASSFWGWGIFGALILVGPFIYLHKLATSMNLLSADYNSKG